MNTKQPVLVTPKAWYTSKTLWFAVITGALGIVTALQTIYPEAGALITIASIINILLRFSTSAPVQ